MLSEIVGAEQASALDQSHRFGSGPNETQHEHLRMDKLNSMTMGQFELNFVKEINELVT